MNWKNATRRELINIIYFDEEVSLSIKAEAMAELIKRNRARKFLIGCQVKIRRKRA